MHDVFVIQLFIRLYIWGFKSSQTFVDVCLLDALRVVNTLTWGVQSQTGHKCSIWLAAVLMYLFECRPYLYLKVCSNSTYLVLHFPHRARGYFTYTVVL